MKTYEEMARSALERVKTCESEQKKPGKTALRIMVPVIGICLVAVLGVGGLKMAKNSADNDPPPTHDALDTKAPSSETAEKESKECESNVHIEEPDTTKAAGVSETEPTEITTAHDTPKSLEAFSLLRWKNLKVAGILAAALNSDPEKEQEITAQYRPTTADVTDFIYEGKSLSEWAVEAYAEGTEEEKNAAMAGYKCAYIAYMDYLMPSFAQKLSDAGIGCRRTPYASNSLTFFANADKLENIPLNDIGNWSFYLASATKDDSVKNPDVCN